MTGHASKKADIELITIYEISKILNSSPNLNQTVHEVLNVLTTHLQIPQGLICLVHENGGLHIVGASGMSDEEVKRGIYQSGEGVLGKIVKSGMPIVVPDISKEPLFLNRTASRDPQGMSDRAFIGVPIKVGHENIGAIAIDRYNHNHRIDFQGAVRLLTMIANLIGQTVRLHQNVAEERDYLMREKNRLQKELKGVYRIDNVVGQSKRMQDVFAEVHQAARGRATVLLRGESGTGKEVIARAIHFMSARKDKPFIAVNCAALTETLLESELFGHERGAFTGATQERKGRFELANGGTLFLDEMGDISPAFQTKLLRVLQEREFERVGGNKAIRTDVRLIAATNRNLEEMVAKGQFRADLYYRINVVTISLPALRERKEDIPLLVQHFLQKFNKENQRNLAIAPEAMQVMLNCMWPGNVRELENCVERTATMTRGNLIRDVDLPCQQGKCFSLMLQSYGAKDKSIAFVPPPSHETVHKDTTPETAPPAPTTERERLIQAMEQSGWVQAKAARILGLTPRQIGYALKKYKIDVRRF